MAIWLLAETVVITAIKKQIVILFIITSIFVIVYSSIVLNPLSILLINSLLPAINAHCLD